MGLIALSAASVSKNKDKPLFCDQKNFNEAIEVAVKMIDRLDRTDRLFAEEE